VGAVLACGIGGSLTCQFHAISNPAIPRKGAFISLPITRRFPIRRGVKGPPLVGDFLFSGCSTREIRKGWHEQHAL